jgi:hypothetical protein
MQSGSVEELNNRLCNIEYQLSRLMQLPNCEAVEKHICDLERNKNRITTEVNNIEEYRGRRDASVTRSRSGSSSKIKQLVLTNDSRIRGMLNHFDTTRLRNISTDIKDIVTPEFEKTIHIFSGKPNYREEQFEDVDIKGENDKDTLKNIDKVLRDLHYFNMERYKEISNEFPKRSKTKQYKQYK